MQEFCAVMKNEKNISAPFSIIAEKKGKRAEVRIIGVIGWESNSESFRRDVDALIADGVKDVHLYINTPGGSCYDANEIVNIVSKFKGVVTGEGGALVASAGTYIALHCKEFTMPANGQFMVHKPKGFAEGTVGEIENYIKGLRNIDNLYYEAYCAVVKSESDLRKHWGSGDWWMTADEALEMGFITAVGPRAKIDKETAALANALGCPVALSADGDEGKNKVPPVHSNSKNNKKNFHMELIALALGLTATATEAEITAKLNDLKGQAARTSELEKSLHDVRDAQITAMVDAAVGKKITADKRQHFIDLGKTVGADTLKATLDAIPEAVKPTDVIVPGKAPDGKTDKKFEDLTEPELTAMRGSDRDGYSRLFKARYGYEPTY
jgi:ATP-dependent protease ClpP protease subunit